MSRYLSIMPLSQVWQKKVCYEFGLSDTWVEELEAGHCFTATTACAVELCIAIADREVYAFGGNDIM